MSPIDALEGGMASFETKRRYRRLVNDSVFADRKLTGHDWRCHYSITSSARASSVSGPSSGASVRSGAEDEACAGIGAQEFVRYFGLSRLVERLTSAVQWNDVVDVHTLDRRYRVAHIVFLIGCKVEAPDDCVNFVDARSRLGLFDRIDHPAMTAGGQYDQPASP